jgi:hypothetical protein
MATVLEGCVFEEQRSVVRSLWAKGRNAKDIHKEMVPVCGGKCLSRKAAHKWVKKRGKRYADDREVETEVRKWLRQHSKELRAAGFDALVKRWDKCIIGGGYVEKCFLARFEYHMFYIFYPFRTTHMRLREVKWRGFVFPSVGSSGRFLLTGR